MDDSKNEIEVENYKEENEGESEHEGNKETLKQNGEKQFEDEAQLRKISSRPYRSVIRSRKHTTITNHPPVTNQQGSHNGRSKSLTWHRASSIFPHQFGSNLFVRKTSRQNKKLSAPITLSPYKRRHKR